MKKHSQYKVVYLKRRRVVTDLLTAALKDNKDVDMSVPMFSFSDFLQEKSMSTSH